MKHFFHRLGTKISFIFIVFVLASSGFIFFFMHRGMKHMEEQLYDSRLEADINYIEDLIGSGSWNIKDGAIYLGDTLVGDGTDENANLEPFLAHEQKTGTFSYVFIICEDEGLGYVESTDTQKGYEQGHYLRVAGSTKDPDGNSIVGTYISKDVADVLDTYGEYKGEANVSGGIIYCLYHTLIGEDDKIVGAIVVGRSISEMKSFVTTTLITVIFSIVIIFAISASVLLVFIRHWTHTLEDVSSYMKLIEEGTFPEYKLQLRTHDEISQLAAGMNSLVEALKENSVLRIKSETDPLTGLANRFGLSRYSENIFEDSYKKHTPIAIFILDIDYFKQYNDNYGHPAGDEAIVMLSELIKDIAETHPLFASRYGGDEFLLIMHNYSKPDVEAVAEILRENLYNTNFVHAFSPISDRLTISQGICYGIPDDYQHMNDYLQLADSALYDVKEEGKNNYKIVDAQIHEEYHQDASNKS